MQHSWMLNKQGMYDPQYEHDACGIAMLANINGRQNHTIISQAIFALERLNHRGGRDGQRAIGDGAGILTQIPHKLFQNEWKKQGVILPEQGMYGVGMFFLPQNKSSRKRCEEIINHTIVEENLDLIGIRHVPINDTILSQKAKETQPVICQVFIKSPFEQPKDIKFERKLYKLRRKIENTLKK